MMKPFNTKNLEKKLNSMDTNCKYISPANTNNISIVYIFIFIFINISITYSLVLTPQKNVKRAAPGLNSRVHLHYLLILIQEFPSRVPVIVQIAIIHRDISGCL